MRTYFKSIDINNYREDTYYTKVKEENHIESLQLQKIDISLIKNLREYIYNNINELIKFTFLDQKVNME